VKFVAKEIILICIICGRKKIINHEKIFIDRDGTIVLEPEGISIRTALDKSRILSKSVSIILAKIASELDYEIAMVTNQDGLGTDSFP